jgi:hypothetical protein
MSKSFSSTTFLVHLLLASTTISSVFAAVTPHRRDPNNDRHSTHCRVKRKGGPDVQVDRPALNTTASTSALPNTATLADAATPSPIPSPTVRQALPPFDYGNRKVRGVNLGGWFMMEVCSHSPILLYYHCTVILLFQFIALLLFTDENFYIIRNLLYPVCLDDPYSRAARSISDILS